MKNLLKITLLILVLSFALVGCGDSDTAVDTAAGYNPGTYEGSADGYGGELKVEVSFSDSEIESINVLENSETEAIAGPAIEEVPAAILDSQDTNVDGVSGATVTSNAIKAAVEDAIRQATN